MLGGRGGDRRASRREPDGPVTERPRQHYRVTFAVLALGSFAYCILQSMVLPALPTLQHDLHTSESTVAWVLTAYLLSASVATPIVGRLGDMYGKERMLVVVFAVLSAGTLLAALATSISVMIAARVIQGIGGAVFPLAFGIIRDEFPEDRVAGGLGLISTILGVGSGLGIVLGGPIVQDLSYHWLFWIPLGMTLLALVSAILFVPESPVKVPGPPQLRRRRAHEHVAAGPPGRRHRRPDVGLDGPGHRRPVRRVGRRLRGLGPLRVPQPTTRWST